MPQKKRSVDSSLLPAFVVESGLVSPRLTVWAVSQSALGKGFFTLISLLLKLFSHSVSKCENLSSRPPQSLRLSLLAIICLSFWQQYKMIETQDESIVPHNSFKLADQGTASLLVRLFAFA